MVGQWAIPSKLNANRSWHPLKGLLPANLRVRRAEGLRSMWNLDAIALCNVCLRDRFGLVRPPALLHL